MKKRMIVTMVMAGMLGVANAQNTSNTEGHVQSATTISRVLGGGRKVETVVLQYWFSINCLLLLLLLLFLFF